METALSCTEEVLPYVLMMVVECVEVGMLTLSKAAMNQGMSNLVYVVYYNGLGTLLLLPYFIIHRHRSNRLPLTFSLLSSCFVLGLLGCLLQVGAYTGIGYSSPTLAAALGNLIPGFTFLLAIIFSYGFSLIGSQICLPQLEKLELRRSSSQAKALGTLVAIIGAFVMTLYKGPPIGFKISPDSAHQTLLSQQSTWVLGALIITMACIFSSIWNVFQAATIKAYPDETTVVFFYFCFLIIQCTIFTLLVERNPVVWVLRPGIQITAVVFSGIAGSVFRVTVITWCMRKKGPVFVALFKPIEIVIAAISGIMFLGDTLLLGSVIGGSIIAVGFYAVMWGSAKEKKMEVEGVGGLESCSTQKSPLLHKTNTHGECPVMMLGGG